MSYIINTDSHYPAYLQLYQKLKSDIVEGIFPSGSKLPSKRTMADAANVSTVTVEHAYSLLCEEGYAEARERSGFFVIFQSDDGFAASPIKEVPVTAHSLTQYLPQFPMTVLTKTMRKVMSDYGSVILERSPNSGRTELREALRQYLARNRGINADIQQIIIGSGAEYLYSLIVGILGRQRIFAIESPSYEKIEKVYRASGIQCDPLPLGSDGIESFALSNTEASVLHISPYRSYPTGITASASKRHEYIRWAGKKHRFIVEDDFESEFSVSGKAEETLFKMSEDDNIIYLNTFSKTVSPALRIGYMVLPRCLVNDFNDKLGFLSCTVPTFEQLVLAELIMSGDFERNINRVRRNKRKALYNK